jgi:hypothetical protein
MDESFQQLAMTLIGSLELIRDEKGDEGGIAFCGRIDADLWNEFVTKVFDMKEPHE